MLNIAELNFVGDQKPYIINNQEYKFKKDAKQAFKVGHTANSSGIGFNVIAPNANHLQLGANHKGCSPVSCPRL